MQAPGPGSVIGGFRIDSLLGQGGMGKVFRATQLRLSRPVALKILPPEFMARGRKRLERFLREAQLAAQLSHPNIVQVFDAGEEGGVFFMAMELLDGRDLKEEVSRRGPLSEEQAADVFLQCAKALEAALDQNLIHRDIKPDNIILTSKGLVKVADFGLARDLASADRITAPGAVIGTPAFMSPEQGSGEEVDHRSDLYSLGATMYFALTGRFPYSSDKPAEIIRMHVKAPVPDPGALKPGLSTQVRAMIMKLMAKAPADRYQTVKELIKDLEEQGLRRMILASSASAGDPAFGKAATSSEPEQTAQRVQQPQADTLDVPDGALEEKYGGHDRFVMETVDESEEAAARLTVAEVEARDFEIMAGLPRTKGLDTALLVAPGDPHRKVFIFSREIVKFGRQSVVDDPKRGKQRVDAVIRALPCRSKDDDPENYARNLTISRHHGTFRIGGGEVVLENPGAAQGLSVDGRRIEVGRSEALPEKCLITLARNSMTLAVRLFGAEGEGRIFNVKGEPARPGVRLLGMDGSSRIAAMRVDRPRNSSNHSYVLLVRQALVGDTDDCAVRIPGVPPGCRLIRWGDEFFLASPDTCQVSVDGMLVGPGTLAPLAHGTIISVGGIEMKFRAILDDDFKNV